MDEVAQPKICLALSEKSLKHQNGYMDEATETHERETRELGPVTDKGIKQRQKNKKTATG
ncbi:MAG: hypothetical protein ABJL35_00040 [Parasphingorhabdus sp.]|uniref:hypothetical protein n=1 Tax=Parasphingorhabdus sp. TaxID=2709688 RepID=UPI0032986A73